MNKIAKSNKVEISIEAIFSCKFLYFLFKNIEKTLIPITPIVGKILYVTVKYLFSTIEFKYKNNAKFIQ